VPLGWRKKRPILDTKLACQESSDTRVRQPSQPT
jgi:hypothetical protein